MHHFSVFMENEWAGSGKAGRNPSGELTAGKRHKRELGSPMETIYFIPLDLNFLICTMEYLAL